MNASAFNISVLNKLHNRFQIETQQLGCSASDLDALKEYASIEIPKDYLDIISEASEIEIAIDENEYIRIWGSSGVIEMNVQANQ